MNISEAFVSYNTANFSKLFKAYINDVESLKPLHSGYPAINAFSSTFEDADKNTNREVLVNVLKEQYDKPRLKSDIAKHSAVLTSIESLSKKNTFTVCTGHQLCLFTGPLYFIYKIITTIKLAKELKNKFPDYNVVPVYWMATEDHDFEEINHVNIFGKHIEWNKEEAQGSSIMPVGKIKTQSLEKVINQLKDLLGNSSNANELIDIVKSAYLGSENLADATRVFVHHLFGEYGLLVMDPSNKEFKKLFSGIMKDELLHQKSQELVNESISIITKNGFDAQVNPREINLFYITDTARERIVLEDNKYKVLNTEYLFSKEEILEKLEKEPQLFSPNVILRPLYQQILLPNLAVVGGPAEIAYWLELKKLFETNKVYYPLLVPRNSVLIIDEKSVDVMNKVGMSDEDVFLSKDELIRKTINSNVEISLADYAEELKITYEKIGNRVVLTDKSLQSAVEAELQKSLNALNVLTSKMIRAEKQKQETSVKRIEKLKEKFFPSDGMQERHDNFIPHYLKYGASFIKLLIDRLNPLDFRVLLLKESPENQ